MLDLEAERIEAVVGCTKEPTNAVTIARVKYCLDLKRYRLLGRLLAIHG